MPDRGAVFFSTLRTTEECPRHLPIARHSVASPGGIHVSYCPAFPYHVSQALPASVACVVMFYFYFADGVAAICMVCVFFLISSLLSFYAACYCVRWCSCRCCLCRFCCLYCFCFGVAMKHQKPFNRPVVHPGPPQDVYAPLSKELSTAQALPGRWANVRRGGPRLRSGRVR